MEKIFFLIALSSISFNTFAHEIQTKHIVGNAIQLMDENAFLNFCHQNPHKIYQDIFVNGRVIFQGISICDVRYDIIKPILQSYKKHFSFLDIGAAFGYFSFRIGTEFPQSQCIMIEHGNKEAHYNHHQNILYQLCHLNYHLKNICYLHKELSLEVLENLNRNEHFDVVLVLLVIHQVEKSMDKRIKALETILELGDNVIIELANDVAPELLPYVHNQLSKSSTHDCTFLGEVDRFYKTKSVYKKEFTNGKGLFYLFTKKEQSPDSYYHKYPQGIKPSTFTAMNGVSQYGYLYPKKSVV